MIRKKRNISFIIVMKTKKVRDWMNYKKAAGVAQNIGRPAIGSKPSYENLIKLYIEDKKSIREIADILGCSKDMVFNSLQEYGIKTRKGSKRSKLKDVELEELIKMVSTIGLTNTAKSLGVDIRTVKKQIEKA
ncbi:MAG: hypothetical protein KJ874_12425 [Acidobacteria bacterium]|nr:hypothetical protein [Acidobacteriota bacterium]